MHYIVKRIELKPRTNKIDSWWELSSTLIDYHIRLKMKRQMKGFLPGFTTEVKMADYVAGKY